MMVAERIDKSGRVHPQRWITLDYLVEQSEDQVRKYPQYWAVLENATQDR
jgi:hypothetical protein